MCACVCVWGGGGGGAHLITERCDGTSQVSNSCRDTPSNSLHTPCVIIALPPPPPPLHHHNVALFSLTMGAMFSSSSFSLLRSSNGTLCLCVFVCTYMCVLSLFTVCIYNGTLYVCVCVHMCVFSLVPSLIPSFYHLQYEKLFFMNSKKAGGGLGTRLVCVCVHVCVCVCMCVLSLFTVCV